MRIGQEVEEIRRVLELLEVSDICVLAVHPVPAVGNLRADVWLLSGKNRAEKKACFGLYHPPGHKYRSGLKKKSATNAQKSREDVAFAAFVD